jgi:hypothetical protein
LDCFHDSNGTSLVTFVHLGAVLAWMLRRRQHLCKRSATSSIFIQIVVPTQTFHGCWQMGTVTALVNRIIKSTSLNTSTSSAHDDFFDRTSKIDIMYLDLRWNNFLETKPLPLHRRKFSSHSCSANQNI